jgi:hypothetical protein
MTGMRNADSPVCWAPECGNVPPPSRGSRPSRYCSPACRVRALRRNGGTAPSEPYPPLEPTPLQQHAASVTVAEQSEPGRSDAAGKARKARRDSVQPPAGTITAGTAPAPAVSDPPKGATGTPETVARGGAAVAPPAAAPVTHLHVAVTEDATVPVTITVHPMVAQYRRDLERMGIAETRQGLHIIAMAEKLVSSATSASAATTVSKELERLMQAAEESTPEAQISADPSVAIRERTLAKLRALADDVEATG